MQEDKLKKIDRTLAFIEKYLTRLNVYLVFLGLALLAIFADSLSLNESFKFFLKKLFENKLWPIFPVAFELFLREVEKKTLGHHKDVLARIEAVIVSGGNLDPGYLLAILKGRDGEISSSMTDAYVDARIRNDSTVK
jgi:dolichol kinase